MRAHPSESKLAASPDSCNTEDFVVRRCAAGRRNALVERRFSLPVSFTLPPRVAAKASAGAFLNLDCRLSTLAPVNVTADAHPFEARSTLWRRRTIKVWRSLTIRNDNEEGRRTFPVRLPSLYRVRVAKQFTEICEKHLDSKTI